MMGMCFAENSPRNRQSGVIDLKETSDPSDLFPIGFLLRDLFCQIGQANQIFLRGIRQKGKSASRKFHFGVLFGSLIKIHLPSKPEENSKKKLTSLPPIRYGLK
jgi:hypothetical protein